MQDILKKNKKNKPQTPHFDTERGNKAKPPFSCLIVS